MKQALLMDFVVDKEAKKIHVTREFDAPRKMVWAAWTVSELLDQWWAPKPWTAKTKSMDFREGGTWLYAMVGPKGEEQWCKADYKKIVKFDMFSVMDGFCDSEGNINPALPRTNWLNKFEDKEAATEVNIEISFDQLEDLETILKMGFKEGFTAGLENLDLFLSTNFKLRQENQTTQKPRVATYLNFPGNTEEAILFYKKVFKGEFTGMGLQRFGDVVLPEQGTPLSEADKKLIIHAELTILGGHVLMATDAPESMGFNMIKGNNMHINVEPDSKKETDRLFQELSEGGVVTMPLQEMFWGAYFGSFTDKYGINWMLNFQNPAH